MLGGASLGLYGVARRLAATETNMAYRTADHERWQQLDFVVGIHIECSALNHVVPDICDTLAGDYPKDFKWTGWHPHCRCHATSILKTDEELDRDAELIDAGEEPSSESVNAVTELPDKFTKWVELNEKKIQQSWSKDEAPYFIADNADAIYGEKIGDGERDGLKLRLGKSGLPLSPSAEVRRCGRGYLAISEHVERDRPDFPKLEQCANFFARQNESVVMLTPRMSRPSNFAYSDYYKDLIGTPYEGKCPDFKMVDKNGKGIWYEHEGFTTTNAHNALRNMLGDGLKQSSRLVIEQPNLTDAYIKRVLWRRIQEGQTIDEVWVKKGLDIRLIWRKS